MKVKDLLKFNPDADISLLGLDYVPIKLDIYGWSEDDTDIETTETDYNNIKEIHLIPSDLDKKYLPTAEA